MRHRLVLATVAFVTMWYPTIARAQSPAADSVARLDSACTVVGVAEWEFEFNGRVDATRRRYSATWVRGGSLGWQMVALHISTALAP